MNPAEHASDLAEAAVERILTDRYLEAAALMTAAAVWARVAQETVEQALGIR